MKINELSGLAAGQELEFEVRTDLQIMWVTVFPNLPSDDARFSYELTAPADVRINIYSVAGCLVKSIAGNLIDSPIGVVKWDGRDKEGERLASGTYLYRITAGDGKKSTHQLGKLAIVR